MMQGVLDLDSLPPGYRFVPTDEELICYLITKVRKMPLPLNKIQEVNICLYKPDELAEMYGGGRREQEAMYFFSPSPKNYNGTYSNRKIRTGKWRATSGGRNIPVKEDKMIMGHARPLKFLEGGEQSEWLMQEYSVFTQEITAGRLHNSTKWGDWVLCKIYETKRRPRASNEGPASINGTHGADQYAGDLENTVGMVLHEINTTDQEWRIILPNYDPFYEEWESRITFDETYYGIHGTGA